MYPTDSGNNNIQHLMSPYYNNIPASMNANNMVGIYDESNLNYAYLGGNFLDYSQASGGYMPTNGMPNNLPAPMISSMQNPVFPHYNMINENRMNNQVFYPQHLENYQMYNDFSAGKTPFFINDEACFNEMPQVFPQVKGEGNMEDWYPDNPNYTKQNENIPLINQKTITNTKNTKCLSQDKIHKGFYETKKENREMDLYGTNLVSNSKQNNLKSNQYEMQTDKCKVEDVDENSTEKNNALNQLDTNELNYSAQGINNMNPNSIHNNNYLPQQFFSQSFYAGHPQHMPVIPFQNNIPYFANNHSISSVVPSALSPSLSFCVVPEKNYPYPHISKFSMYQNPYAVEYTPFTAHQLSITLDRLEDVPKSYEGFESYNFFVVAYIHEEDENKEKLKTRSFEFCQGKSRNLINCDLQKSMLKIPWNGEEFLRLKIMEENEFRSDVLGRIELHIETLQQRTLLRVPIIGECNEHKGYLIFSVNISSNSSYPVNSSQNELVKSYNSLIKTKTKKRNESEKNSIVNFFMKWCCELPAIDLN